MGECKFLCYSLVTVQRTYDKGLISVDDDFDDDDDYYVVDDIIIMLMMISVVVK